MAYNVNHYLRVGDAKTIHDAVQGQVDDLKSAIEQIDNKLDHVKSANIFDVSKAIAGNVDTSGNISASTSNKTSDFIPVTAGDTLKSYYQSGSSMYAANMRYLCAYDSAKNAVSASGSSSSINTYTVPDGISYIRFSASNGVIDGNLMLVVGTTAPTTYVPYYDYYIATGDFIEKALSEADVAILPITKDNTDFWSKIKSANLFDKNAITSGEYFNTDGSTRTASNVFRSYVDLDGAGTYSFNVMGNFYGLANAVKIPTFDKNKSFIKTITGSTEATSASNKDLMTLVISQQDISDGVVYIGYSEHPDNLNDLMVVKSATYPDNYIPFFEFWSIPDLKNVDANPLFGKKAVFDGDSICAGNGSAMGDYGNGWAGRIGVDNAMEYYNVGVSGACITAETYFDGGSARHWISRYIDTIHTNYPDADYIIAEGGTNDADNFYGDETKLGTFDETDFTGPFDDTTFYGAMDSWCKKALTYFPKAKIGFIVAQKMGLGFASYTKNRYDYFAYAEKVCKKWGIPVINLWDDGQLRPDVVSNYNPEYNTIETATEHGLLYYDGQHLTAYGYDVISHKISEWMKTL